jgi:hypothetical protein
MGPMGLDGERADEVRDEVSREMDVLSGQRG